jgi:hypothetical protein
MVMLPAAPTAGSRIPFDKVKEAANRLGITTNLEEVEIENGIARLNIGTTEQMQRADLQLVRDFLAGEGANTIEINAGLVQNQRLSDALVNHPSLALGAPSTVEVVQEVDLGPLGVYRILKITSKIGD